MSTLSNGAERTVLGDGVCEAACGDTFPGFDGYGENIRVDLDVRPVGVVTAADDGDGLCLVTTNAKTGREGGAAVRGG